MIAGVLVGLVVLIVLIAIVLPVVLSGAKSARVLNAAHYREVAERLQEIKKAALERIEDGDADEPSLPSPDLSDPRAAITGGNLAMYYTIVRYGSEFVHHYSVSIAGGNTPHAVGERFILYIADLLSVAPTRLEAGYSPSSVHHAVFTLTHEEQELFAAHPVTPPEPGTEAAVMEACVVRGRAVVRF